MNNTKFLFLCLSMFLVISCAKETNGNLPEGIEEVNIPLLTKDPSSAANIDFTNINNFNGKFNVDLYFKAGPKPEKVDVVAIKNGQKTSVKVIQASITSLPTSVSVNKSMLESAFGPGIKVGDRFTFGIDSYHNGKKYEAFPLTGVAYGTNIPNLTGSNTFINFDVVCAFDINNFFGDFDVIKDDWDDYKAGTVIKVVRVSNTSVSFNYNCADAVPIVLSINTSTGAVSSPKIQYCSYILPPLTKFFGDVVEGNGSFVDFCTKTITVKINHTDEKGGNYGDGTIVLRKK